MIHLRRFNYCFFWSSIHSLFKNLLGPCTEKIFLQGMGLIHVDPCSRGLVHSFYVHEEGWCQQGYLLPWLKFILLGFKAVESAKKYVTGCDQQWSQFSVVEKGTEAWMTVASSAAVCDKSFIPVWPASIRNFTMFFSLRGQLFSILEWRWQVVRGRVPWRLKVRSIHCTSIVTLWWTSIM